jgi:predicted transcriptional regulator
MKAEKLETVVQLRIYENLRAKLQRLADFESRSLSQYIRLALVRHVEKIEEGQAELRRKKGEQK